MLTIRGCEACQARIRTTVRALVRPGRCPYCRAALEGGAMPSVGLVPTRIERTAWTLSWLIQGLGIVLPLVVFLGHKWFDMNWLGGGLVGLILAFMLSGISWGTRVGAKDEWLGLNIFATVLALLLVVFGFFAFSPLDGLGGAAMVLMSLGAVIVAGPMESNLMLRERADYGRFGGWLILLSFLAAYVYHAAKPWLGK